MQKRDYGTLSQSLLCAAAVCGLLLAGCGGGASTEPSVKIKSADDDAGGRPTDGGGTSDAAVQAGVGNWKGRVVFAGTPPPLDPLVRQGQQIKDAEVCAAQTIPDQTLVVGPNSGVANVFVFLSRAPRGGSVPPPTGSAVVFDQKSCIFMPHALFVRTGQTVKVKSDDAILHNTHTLPKRNPAFNQGIQPNEREGVDLVYQQPEPEPFEVKCDIHAWMRAYHIALDHPFCAVTGDDGTFEITGLPAGTHGFKVWHEGVNGGYISRNLEVTINADATTETEIEYPAEKFALDARPANKVVNLTSLLRE